MSVTQPTVECILPYSTVDIKCFSFVHKRDDRWSLPAYLSSYERNPFVISHVQFETSSRWSWIFSNRTNSTVAQVKSPISPTFQKTPLSLLLAISLFLGKSMADQSTNPLIMDAKSVHPLHQIAETPTHRLLLKQWLKEEELILNRISLKETQIDGVRREITQLYCFFFIFHSTLLILLFNNSSSNPNGSACHRSWIPSLCSLLCSLGLIWAVRYKTDVESHMEKLLEREKEDGKLLGKCVEELKKKGVEFDLLKEVDALRRAKSLRVEAKAVRKWSARDFVTFFFFTVSCLVLGLVRVILCN